MLWTLLSINYYYHKWTKEDELSPDEVQDTAYDPWFVAAPEADSTEDHATLDDTNNVAEGEGSNWLFEY